MGLQVQVKVEDEKLSNDKSEFLQSKNNSQQKNEKTSQNIENLTPKDRPQDQFLQLSRNEVGHDNSTKSFIAESRSYVSTIDGWKTNQKQNPKAQHSNSKPTPTHLHIKSFVTKQPQPSTFNRGSGGELMEKCAGDVGGKGSVQDSFESQFVLLKDINSQNAEFLGSGSCTARPITQDKLSVNRNHQNDKDAKGSQIMQINSQRKLICSNVRPNLSNIFQSTNNEGGTDNLDQENEQDLQSKFISAKRVERGSIMPPKGRKPYNLETERATEVATKSQTQTEQMQFDKKHFSHFQKIKVEMTQTNFAYKYQKFNTRLRTLKSRDQAHRPRHKPLLPSTTISSAFPIDLAHKTPKNTSALSPTLLQAPISLAHPTKHAPVTQAADPPNFNHLSKQDRLSIGILSDNQRIKGGRLLVGAGTGRLAETSSGDQRYDKKRQSVQADCRGQCSKFCFCFKQRNVVIQEPAKRQVSKQQTCLRESSFNIVGDETPQTISAGPKQSDQNNINNIVIDNKLHPENSVINVDKHISESKFSFLNSTKVANPLPAPQFQNTTEALEYLSKESPSIISSNPVQYNNQITIRQNTLPELHSISNGENSKNSTVQDEAIDQTFKKPQHSNGTILDINLNEPPQIISQINNEVQQDGDQYHGIDQLRQPDKGYDQINSLKLPQYFDKYIQPISNVTRRQVQRYHKSQKNLIINRGTLPRNPLSIQQRNQDSSISPKKSNESNKNDLEISRVIISRQGQYIQKLTKTNLNQTNQIQVHIQNKQVELPKQIKSNLPIKHSRKLNTANSTQLTKFKNQLASENQQKLRTSQILNMNQEVKALNQKFMDLCHSSQYHRLEKSRASHAMDTSNRLNLNSQNDNLPLQNNKNSIEHADYNPGMQTDGFKYLKRGLQKNSIGQHCKSSHQKYRRVLEPRSRQQGILSDLAQFPETHTAQDLGAIITNQHQQQADIQSNHLKTERMRQSQNMFNQVQLGQTDHNPLNQLNATTISPLPIPQHHHLINQAPIPIPTRTRYPIPTDRFPQTTRPTSISPQHVLYSNSSKEATNFQQTHGPRYQKPSTSYRSCNPENPTIINPHQTLSSTLQRDDFQDPLRRFPMPNHTNAMVAYSQQKKQKQMQIPQKIWGPDRWKQDRYAGYLKRYEKQGMAAKRSLGRGRKIDESESYSEGDEEEGSRHYGMLEGDIGGNRGQAGMPLLAFVGRTDKQAKKLRKNSKNNKFRENSTQPRVAALSPGSNTHSYSLLNINIGNDASMPGQQVTSKSKSRENLHNFINAQESQMPYSEPDSGGVSKILTAQPFPLSPNVHMYQNLPDHQSGTQSIIMTKSGSFVNFNSIGLNDLKQIEYQGIHAHEQTQLEQQLQEHLQNHHINPDQILNVAKISEIMRDIQAGKEYPQRQEEVQNQNKRKDTQSLNSGHLASQIRDGVVMSRDSLAMFGKDGEQIAAGGQKNSQVAQSAQFQIPSDDSHNPVDPNSTNYQEELNTLDRLIQVSHFNQDLDQRIALQKQQLMNSPKANMDLQSKNTLFDHTFMDQSQRYLNSEIDAEMHHGQSPNALPLSHQVTLVDKNCQVDNDLQGKNSESSLNGVNNNLQIKDSGRLDALADQIKQQKNQNKVEDNKDPKKKQLEVYTATTTVLQIKNTSGHHTSHQLQEQSIHHNSTLMVPAIEPVTVFSNDPVGSPVNNQNNSHQPVDETRNPKNQELIGTTLTNNSVVVYSKKQMRKDEVGKVALTLGSKNDNELYYHNHHNAAPPMHVRVTSKKSNQDVNNKVYSSQNVHFPGDISLNNHQILSQNNIQSPQNSTKFDMLVLNEMNNAHQLNQQSNRQNSQDQSKEDALTKPNKLQFDQMLLQHEYQKLQKQSLKIDNLQFTQNVALMMHPVSKK